MLENIIETEDDVCAGCIHPVLPGVNANERERISRISCIAPFPSTQTHWRSVTLRVVLLEGENH